jgi:hypothetical protein
MVQGKRGRSQEITELFAVGREVGRLSKENTDCFYEGEFTIFTLRPETLGDTSYSG